MPWDPSERNLVPQIILSTAQGLEGDIRSGIEDYNKTKTQNEFNSGAFETILNNPATRGAIPQELIAKFPKMSPDAASGALAQILGNIKNQRDLQQQTNEINALAGVRAAQANNLTADASRTMALTPTEKANIQSETTERNINSLLGIQKGVQGAERPPAGKIERLLDPKTGNFQGWQITQPNGTVTVKTPGTDLSELLGALVPGGAPPAAGGAAGGGAAGGGVPPAAATGAPPAPAGAPRIRVKGPQGQTGTASAGAPLPAGWVQIP